MTARLSVVRATETRENAAALSLQRTYKRKQRGRGGGGGGVVSAEAVAEELASLPSLPSMNEIRRTDGRQGDEGGVGGGSPRLPSTLSLEATTAPFEGGLNAHIGERIVCVAAEPRETIMRWPPPSRLYPPEPMPNPVEPSRIPPPLPLLPHSYPNPAPTLPQPCPNPTPTLPQPYPTHRPPNLPRLSVLDGDVAVAYETAVLGALRPGLRSFQLRHVQASFTCTFSLFVTRHMLLHLLIRRHVFAPFEREQTGTRIDLCSVLVHIRETLVPCPPLDTFKCCVGRESSREASEPRAHRRVPPRGAAADQSIV